MTRLCSHALATNKLVTEGLKFTHILSDIEDLNRRALSQEFEVSAVSFHAYPYLQDQYRLLNHGGSVGYWIWPHDRGVTAADRG